MPLKKLLPALSTTLLLIITPLLQANAQSAPDAAINFTSAQVDNGKILYRDNCQICHGSTLSNGQFGTPLRGGFFRNSVSGKSLGEILQFTYESMPPDNVMSLETQQYAEIMAYIFSRNRLEPGEIEITGNFEDYSQVMLPW